MAAWRQQEILTTRGGEETLQAVVVRAHRAVRAAAPAWKERIDLLEILGRCGVTQTLEEIRRWHKDGELEFRLS